MADAYWSYGGARYQAPVPPAPFPVKRPRTDYGDVPRGPELVGYYPRDEERVMHRGGTDSEAVGASYDRYLRNGPVSSYGAGESARSGLVEMPRHPVDDGRTMGIGGIDGRTVEFGGGRREKPLPPDASSTLFVEGLPANCTRREVSHVFRPFPGFREVRLVIKESRHAGGDPWVLCFVDFSTPSQATVALDCLEGESAESTSPEQSLHTIEGTMVFMDLRYFKYKGANYICMLAVVYRGYAGKSAESTFHPQSLHTIEGYEFDEHDRDSPTLRLQFSRFPGPRSGGGPRGRR